MADYWKSGEKHFCTFCKCWLAGNKVSIELHERGNHHKSMVQARLTQVRKANQEKEREEKQFNKTLGEIERAANESFRRDMVADASGRLDSGQSKSSTSTTDNLPSKLKRPLDQPVQIQLKKPKFIIKKPTPKPVFEPLSTPAETDTKPEDEKKEEASTDNPNPEGTWYEFKNDAQESYYWNDTTGASSWTAPEVYLSIEDQKAKGFIV